MLFDQGPLPKFWGHWQRAYSSEIMGTEARRAIDRLRLESAIDDDGVAVAHESLARIENVVDRIEITREILRRAAAPMATVVKTLDAIHVASALLLAESHGLTDLTFATLDRQQERSARACGLAVTSNA